MPARPLALATLVLIVGATAALGQAERSCFAACMADHPPKSDDYYAFADDVKGCRDRCDGAALAVLKDSGLDTVRAACKPEPLDRAAFRQLRADNPSWQVQFNVFLWEVRNTLADRLLTAIEVKTQDMNLIDISLTADGVVAPGATGTFVIPDFFDGYPAVRYATR